MTEGRLRDDSETPAFQHFKWVLSEILGAEDNTRSCQLVRIWEL